MSEYIGSKVSIPGTRGYGTLKYYGPIEGKQGIFAGVELTGPIAASRGKNSGAVNGVQYFDVIQPMSGLFLPIERLKQVNPQLNDVANIKTRISSDNLTDSPIDKLLFSPSPPSRYSSQTSHPRSSPLQSQSPPMFNQSITVAKREKIGINHSPLQTPINNLPLPQHAPIPSMPSYSRNSSVDSMDRNKLQKELNELRAKYETSEREMLEKMEILNELRNTVNELQPLLEEYEQDLSEKDKKLAKQKAEFERVREEWRQSLDLMLTTQQETEIIYLEKLSDLHQHIERLTIERDELSKANAPTSKRYGMASFEDIEKYTLQIEDLKMEKQLLEKNSLAKIHSQDLQIRDLKEKLTKTKEELDDVSNTSYHQFTNSAPSTETIEELETELDELKKEKEAFIGAIEELQRTLNQKDQTITELEIKVDQSNDKENIELILKGLNSVKLDYKKTDELEKVIDDLKHQLEIRPTFEELTGLQESLDELQTLHQNELDNDKKQLDSLNQENVILKEKLQELKEENEALKARPEPQPIPQAPSTDLPIYKPPAPTDPSTGKDDWCGLCERDGHSSIDCPYENDIF